MALEPAGEAAATPRLALIYAPTAIGLSVLSLVLLLLFRIDRHAHEANLAAIAARR